MKGQTVDCPQCIPQWLETLWSWSCVFRNLYKCYQKGMNLAFIILANTYSFWGQIAQIVCLTLIQILERIITTYPKIFWVYLHFHILTIKLENLQQKFYFFFIIISFYNQSNIQSDITTVKPSCQSVLKDNRFETPSRYLSGF